jgi:hypothetical protein
LELLKMAQTGELKQLWDVASVTNVRINLVCPRSACVYFLLVNPTLTLAMVTLTLTITVPSSSS